MSKTTNLINRLIKEAIKEKNMSTVSPSRTYVIEYGSHKKVSEEDRETKEVTLPKNLKNEAGIASAYARKKLPIRSYIFSVRPVEEKKIITMDTMGVISLEVEVSKAAANLAMENEIVLAEVTGTGNDGLITINDVRNYIKESEEDEDDSDDLEPDQGVQRGGFSLLS